MPWMISYLLPRVTVLIFLRTDCPVSSRYAPEIQSLANTYLERGVQFRLIFPERELSASRIEKYLDTFHYGLPGMADADRTLVRAAHAHTTPEVAVFRSGVLAYHGRIDNRFVGFGVARPSATERSLDLVLAALTSGNPAPFASRPAVGCAIGDLP